MGGALHRKQADTNGAQLETRAAIEQLLRVAPGYRLRDIDLGNSMFIGGPERGTVEVGPRVSGDSS